MSDTSTDNKIIGTKDIVLLNMSANFGIRWLAIAASLGASAIFFWIVGAFMFFIPLTIIAVYLSQKYPEEGGAYAWTNRALGERSAFMVAWFYWVNNLFYFPTILIFLVANFSYFIGKPQIMNDKIVVTAIVLIVFWAIVVLSFLGLKANKYIGSVGGILGSILPAVLIIVLGIGAFLITGESATSYNLSSIVPQESLLSNLSTLTIIMFAMSGIEIVPTFANSVKGGGKTLYKGLIISAVLLALFYILGTVAINIVIPSDHISQTSGLIEAFSLLGNKLGVSWLAHVVAFLLTFAELAAVSLWLLAPIVMFFKCTPKGVLPNWLHKTNKHDAPVNALLFMGLLVSLIILATNLLPSVDAMYQIMILMTTILYFIPYLYIVVAYLKLADGWFKYIIATAVLVSLALGILFSFQPPSDIVTTRELIVYELELILGPAAFIAVGWLLYKFRR